MAKLGLTAQGVANIRMQLENTRPVAEDLTRQFLMTGRAINEALAQQATAAIDRFAQSVAEGRNVIGSLFDAFRQFAADFLRQIATMILQQLIFNIVSGGGNGKGGAGGAVAGAIGSFFHEGGVVGSGGVRQASFPAALWANATRYHGGGIAGLKPGEVPAILKRGEEVLTERDSRHVANGGGGGTPVNLKNVNIFDSAEMLQHALGTRVGERVLINHVSRNAPSIRAALGVR